MSLNIRRAKATDAERVLDVLKQVNLVHHLIRPDLFNIATKYTKDELLTIFSDDSSPVFVCEKDAKVIGYIFTLLIDHGGSNMLTPIKELYIDDLCVDEDFRGQGAATALYNHAKAYARQIGCHNLTLNVWEGNDAALAFYRKMNMATQKTKLECVLD